MLKKACFFNTFLHGFFSIFDLKIHRFLDLSSTRFAIKSKSARVHETLRGRTKFKDRLLKNIQKFDEKSFQNEGAKRTSQKALQNSIFGANLASPNPRKSRKNLSKTTLKTNLVMLFRSQKDLGVTFMLKTKNRFFRPFFRPQTPFPV